MKNGIILLVVFTSLLSGCTEPLDVKPYTFTQMFTGEIRKGWSIQSLQLIEDGKSTKTFGLSDCIEDDIYIFYANAEHYYEITEGSSVCTEGDSYIILQDAWSFSQATSTLSIGFPLLSDGRIPFVVHEVSTSRLSLDAFFNDDKSRYRINFRSVSVE